MYFGLQHFLKARVQIYMTSKFCWPKFKNGGDMAMGTKTGKREKVKFLAQKVCLTLEENVYIQKDYFQETRPPQKISKSAFFRTAT